MNIEEIDKWLDNEYGVSYTRLEELHDFLIEQNMKYQDKIDDLQQENKQLKDKIEKLKDYGEAVGERRNQLYDKIDKAIDWCNEIIRTFCEDDKQVVVAYEIKEILGDKENEET